MSTDNPTTAIAPFVDDGKADLMWSTAGFNHAQRVAGMFAASQLVPEHLRGKVADVTIALLMARRLNEDPLIVMQNIYSIKGKAGWGAQYVIARANRSGLFASRINWRITSGPAFKFSRKFKDNGTWRNEEHTRPNLSVTAYATLAGTNEEVSFTADMQMAAAESWVDNEKYLSMPELMLRYRSAVLLVRLYAPEVMLGFSAAEELETLPVIDVVAETPAAAPARGALNIPPTVTARAAKPEPAPTVTEPEKPSPSGPSRADLAAECKAIEGRLADELDVTDAARKAAGVDPEAPVSGRWSEADLTSYLRELTKAEAEVAAVRARSGGASGSAPGGDDESPV